MLLYNVAIKASMKSISDWTLTEDSANGDSIFKSFDFNDFKSAFTWMTQAAQLAERNDHHPNWSNLYSSVNVKLTTDDRHCLSSFDVQLARQMDALFKPFSIEYITIARRRNRS